MKAELKRNALARILLVKRRPERLVGPFLESCRLLRRFLALGVADIEIIVHRHDGTLRRAFRDKRQSE